MREIDKLIAEISPKPDVPSSIRKLPDRKACMPVNDAADANASVVGAPAVGSSGRVTKKN